MSRFDLDLEAELSALRADGNYRTLKNSSVDGKYITVDGRRYINMSSNDYLGLGADTKLQQQFFAELAGNESFLMSNPSSRLMTGNGADYERLESAISALYDHRPILVLGNGYMANTGILPALAEKDDLILADKYVHASLIDGLRLSGCEWTRFRHNDTDHLESLLRGKSSRKRAVWVVTESLFSMDGDTAPLERIVELKNRYGFNLYLDEAHAFGVYGGGAGLAAQTGMASEADIIVATLGKAMASFGAFAVMSDNMKKMLVNRMRTLIFSTALPPINLMWSEFLIGKMQNFEGRRVILRGVCEKFKEYVTCPTHIIPLLAPGNENALRKAELLREGGFWVTPIRYPTVARGAERIRLSLTATLDASDIDKLISLWKSIGA